VLFLEEQIVVYIKKDFIFFEVLVVFFFCLTSTSAEVQDLHPARCLLPY